MMIVNTPYTEVYVKKSFLSGAPNYGQDETIFGILVGIRFIRGRAPLYIVFIPSVGALYDKVDQCAIFNKKVTPEEDIRQTDVAYWDSLSDNWQLIELKILKGWDTEFINRSNRTFSGSYLWTCDPLPTTGDVEFGQPVTWHEHKTKNYFFDSETGVLCCGPNNRMRFYDSSLTPSEMESPYWLKVYKDSDSPERVTHESSIFHGDSDNFDYSEEE